jgi:Tfp pilus assembly protein PilN
MIFGRSSVGIEICGNDARLAVTRSNFGKLRLVSVYRISGFMSLNDEERKKAIRTLVKRERIPTGHVYLTLPREHGIVRQVDLPSLMTQKLADVVKLQVETLSPWPLEEIYWDFAQDQQKNRKFNTITIALLPRNLLDPWIAFFKSAGVPLSGAALSSLAYAHGAITFWKETTPSLILHREESYFEGVLVNGNRIAALTDSSGHDSSADAPPDMSALVKRLLSVGKLSSADGARLVICGLNEASDIQQNPRLPLENAGPQSANDFGPIATALLALKDSPFKSNLVPPEQRYRESQLRLIPTYVLAALVILMGLVWLARDSYQNIGYSSRLESEIQKIAPQVKEVADQESELNDLSTRLRAFTATLQTRDRNLEALREISRILPPTAFLSNYSYQDGSITVSGFASSASEIQNLLESSSMFKNAEFTNSVTRDAEKDRFTVKLAFEVSQ